ncbi:MAG: DNA polymerase II [Pseudomonadales bacterium]
MSEYEGFLLTREWRDVDEGSRLRLEYWLSTQAGPRRLVLDGEEAVLFVKRTDQVAVNALLAALPSVRSEEVALRDREGNRLTAIYCGSRDGWYECRRRLEGEAITAYEADVSPADRHLMERFIRGGVRVMDGDSAHRIGPSNYRPRLKVASVDIETNYRTGEILCVGVSTGDEQRVFMNGDVSSGERDLTDCASDERTMLTHFLRWFADCDPDLVTGWNVVGFDLNTLARRCARLGIRFSLGRDGREPRIRSRGRGSDATGAYIPGRVVLDGIESIRFAGFSFESFSLEHVAREVLGRGKLITDVDRRAEEIIELHRSDRGALARYNLEDCQLVLDIFERTALLELILERVRLTGLPMDRWWGSVAAFDNLYLPRLHRNGYVAPRVESEDVRGSPGGYVLASDPGLYRNVVVLDFKSLYPSIIRTFKIDPLGLWKAQDEASTVPGFRGARFSREHHILPQIIEELWQAREVAKAHDDATLSRAIKILMNSFYGVLGTPFCRFYDHRLASSITMRGHEVIKASKEKLLSLGFEVIYGDTDSLFIWLGDEVRDGESQGRMIAAKLNRWLTAWVEEEFALDCYLEIEFETHYQRFLMPTVRGSDAGSKKRYAGLVEDRDGHRVVFKGMERVRSDWTQLAKRFQEELYRRVFMEEAYAEFVQETVAQILGGALDEELIFRKQLRKHLGEYQHNVPPQVRAARLAEDERKRRDLPTRYGRGSWVEYYVTTDGPEVREYRVAALDYGHYIERQIRPVADGILRFLDTSFDELTSRQMTLF